MGYKSKNKGKNLILEFLKCITMFANMQNYCTQFNSDHDMIAESVCFAVHKNNMVVGDETFLAYLRS